MPELPEVETVRLSLESRLPGKVVEGVLVREPRLRYPVDKSKLKRLIRGRRIERLSRRAKYLIIHFSGNSCLVVHLGMTGGFFIVPDAAEIDRHDHVIFRLNDGTHLRFRDPRRFGLVVATTGDELESFGPFLQLGVEPLTRAFSARYLFTQSQGVKKPIKNFLMDQQVVVGVGNIYANEALFLAGVHPARPAYGLNLEEFERLAQAIRKVLRQSIRRGGTTLSDFRDGDGNFGYFQTYLRVYGRESEPCKRCKSQIRRLVLAGRSTFYCSKCQPARG